MDSSKKQEDEQVPFTSNLITQIQEESKIMDNLEQTDPVAFVIKELDLKMSSDARDELR